MMNTRYRFLVLLFIAFTAFNCEEKTQIADMALSAEVSGIPPSLTGNEFYYLYLKNGDIYTYVTEVVPEADSTWSIADVTVEPIQLADAQEVLISVSASENPPGSPDGPIILGADFSGIMTTLSIDHSEAVGKLGAPSGQYRLFSPSTTDTLDWYAGVWFYNPDTASSDTFTLLLPEINETWEYEGWVEVAELDTFLSIGRWSLNDEPDSGNPYTSTEETPYSFPGEDFVINLPDGISAPLDLRGRRFFISIEPVTDPDPDKPFHLVLLNTESLGDQSPRTLDAYDLFSVETPLSGTVSR